MKRYIAVLLAFVSMLQLCACGGAKGPQTTLPPVETGQEVPPPGKNPVHCFDAEMQEI